jgi:hypothetical protein
MRRRAGNGQARAAKMRAPPLIRVEPRLVWQPANALPFVSLGWLRHLRDEKNTSASIQSKATAGVGKIDVKQIASAPAREPCECVSTLEPDANQRPPWSLQPVILRFIFCWRTPKIAAFQDAVDERTLRDRKANRKLITAGGYQIAIGPDAAIICQQSLNEPFRPGATVIEQGIQGFVEDRIGRPVLRCHSDGAHSSQLVGLRLIEEPVLFHQFI